MNKRNSSITRIELNGRKISLTGKHHSYVYQTQQTGTEETVNGQTTFVKSFGKLTYRVFVK